MTVFSWLLIGHLVGDWMLQNDWMAQGKKGGFFTVPGLIHFTIYTATVMGILSLSGVIGINTTFILSIAILVFVSHWLIDGTNLVERWIRFYGQSNIAVVRLMVDQTFHLLVLAGIALIWSIH